VFWDFYQVCRACRTGEIHAQSHVCLGVFFRKSLKAAGRQRVTRIFSGFGFHSCVANRIRIRIRTRVGFTKTWVRIPLLCSISGSKVIVKKVKKLGKSPEILLGIICKISNEDTLRLKSPQWVISNDVLHVNDMCARRVITVQNLCYAWVILMNTHFLYPKIGVSAWILKNFSSLL